MLEGEGGREGMGIGGKGKRGGGSKVLKVLELDTGYSHRSRSACVLQASCPGRGGKSKDTFLAPVGIGLALLVAELAGESESLSFFLRQVMRRNKGLTGWTVGVYYTSGSLNPTRSFGPSVAGTWFPGYLPWS